MIMQYKKILFYYPAQFATKALTRGREGDKGGCGAGVQRNGDVIRPQFRDRPLGCFHYKEFVPYTIGLLAAYLAKCLFDFESF